MGGGNSKPKDIKQLCKETHLTEKQIKQWYTDFCKVSYVKQSLVPDVNLYQSRICFEILRVKMSPKPSQAISNPFSFVQSEKTSFNLKIKTVA